MLSKIFKSKGFACTVTGFILFFFGFTIGCAETDEVKAMREEFPRQAATIEKLEDEVKTLTVKLEQAQPFFDMKAEEQAKLEAQVKLEQEERLAKEKAELEAKQKAELEAKSVTLGNGNFVAGTDFEAGTYDIIALSGSGNVSSTNMFSGGINAIMGTTDPDFYEKEYKNIKLPAGTTLSVNGVKIKLVPKQ